MLRCFDEDDDLRPDKFKVRSFLIALGVQMFLSAIYMFFVIGDTFTKINSIDITTIIYAPLITTLVILFTTLLCYFISYPFRKLFAIIDRKIIIYKDRRNRVRTGNKSRFSTYMEKRKQRKCKKIQYID
jgi:hypothetical protein